MKEYTLEWVESRKNIFNNLKIKNLYSLFLYLILENRKTIEVIVSNDISIDKRHYIDYNVDGKYFTIFSVFNWVDFDKMTKNNIHIFRFPVKTNFKDNKDIQDYINTKLYRDLFKSFINFIRLPKLLEVNYE